MSRFARVEQTMRRAASTGSFRSFSGPRADNDSKIQKKSSTSTPAFAMTVSRGSGRAVQFRDHTKIETVSPPLRPTISLSRFTLHRSGGAAAGAAPGARRPAAGAAQTNETCQKRKHTGATPRAARLAAPQIPAPVPRGRRFIGGERERGSATAKCDHI